MKPAGGCSTLSLHSVTLLERLLTELLFDSLPEKEEERAPGAGHGKEPLLQRHGPKRGLLSSRHPMALVLARIVDRLGLHTAQRFCLS